MSGRLHAPAALAPGTQRITTGLVGHKAGLDVSDNKQISCPSDEKDTKKPTRSEQTWVMLCTELYITTYERL
jgi:hypothetical protein